MRSSTVKAIIVVWLIAALVATIGGITLATAIGHDINKDKPVGLARILN